MLTQIINARILTPQGWLKDGSVLIRDHKILEVTNCDLAVRLANAMDRSHYQKVKALNVTLKDRILYLVVDSARDVSQELGLLKDKKEFFEEVFGIRLVMRRKGRR